MVPVITCAHNDRWHVWLVDILGELLLDFDSSTDQHVVAVNEVTLLEELRLWRHLEHRLCDCYQLLSNRFRVLHEEAETFARGKPSFADLSKSAG